MGRKLQKSSRKYEEKEKAYRIVCNCKEKRRRRRRGNCRSLWYNTNLIEPTEKRGKGNCGNLL
jgi:hypothetical protein